MCIRDSIRKRPRPNPLDSQTVGEATVASDDRTLILRTQIMVPSDTLRTREATERRPSDPNALPDLQTLRVLAKRDDCTHRFMPRYKRVCRHTPFVIQHGEIRVVVFAL